MSAKRKCLQLAAAGFAGGVWLFVFLGVVMAGEKPLKVFVSIPPQVYFVEKIGGELISVEALVPPGENPATFAPTPAKISRLAGADIFFRIGVPFETVIVPKIRNMAGDLTIVDTRQGIALRRMQTSLSKHAGDHDHTEGGHDPHIWMSPLLVKKQVKTMAAALSRQDSDHAAMYNRNCRIFLKELEELHQDLKTTLAPVKGETMFVFHPAFGYLADTYGLQQVAVEMEGKAPKGRALSRFIQRARKEKVRVIFVQPQFDSNAARKIAGVINGTVLPLNPLAKDYMNNLKDMAKSIRDALVDKSTSGRAEIHENY